MLIYVLDHLWWTHKEWMQNVWEYFAGMEELRKRNVICLFVFMYKHIVAATSALQCTELCYIV